MKLVKILGVLITLLVITNVVLSNRSVDLVQSLQETESTVATLEKDVTVIKYQVTQVGSLTKIAESARAQGYIDSTHVAAVTLPGLTASR